MDRGDFDAEAFYAALDAVRQRRKMTWKNVSDESGVSASTLTRMAQGKRPDVDSLARLASWSALDVSMFIAKSRDATKDAGAALEQMTALFRADPNLTLEAAKAMETTLKVLYEHLRSDIKK